MATNFKRNRTQVYIESEIDPSYNHLETDKSKRKTFQQSAESLALNSYQKMKAMSFLEEDAYDYLYAAYVSFLNGIQNVCEHNFSWATVELYYTMFYLLRTKLHLEGIIIFRAGKMYFSNIHNNEGFKPIASQRNTNTHEGTISLFERFFEKTDIIYANAIEDSTPIEWIKEKREIVNYLSVEFKEPEHFAYLEKFCSIDKANESIKKIIQDASLAFQEEFAIIGIPLLLFKEILSDYRININNILSQEKRDYLLSRIVPYGLIELKQHLCL